MTRHRPASNSNGNTWTLTVSSSFWVLPGDHLKYITYQLLLYLVWDLPWKGSNRLVKLNLYEAGFTEYPPKSGFKNADRVSEGDFITESYTTNWLYNRTSFRTSPIHTTPRPKGQKSYRILWCAIVSRIASQSDLVLLS